MPSRSLKSPLNDTVYCKIVAEMEDGIVAIDADGMILYCNHAVESLFQQTSANLIGQPIEALLPPRYRQIHRHHLAGFMEGQVDAKYMGSRKSFITGYRADGTEINLGATILRTGSTDGSVYIAVLRDLTERHGYQHELERLANTDPLSGINNRRAFTNLAGKELARCQQAQDPVSVILFDLDGFKAVNDGYGHDVGDTVICEFAQILKSVVHSGDLLARWGGEEFVLMMPDTSVERCAVIADMVRRNVESLEFGTANGVSLRITVSAGVSTAAAASESLDDLIRRADHALYAAKSSGRNRIIVEPPAPPLAA
ncbi:MAG: sensor domain-containing diguanylate cyclase [Rhizobium sp.]|nr:sensor domain-containing diguanylate cyclase [Rhizobium sp.]